MLRVESLELATYMTEEGGFDLVMDALLYFSKNPDCVVACLQLLTMLSGTFHSFCAVETKVDLLCCSLSCQLCEA